MIEKILLIVILATSCKTNQNYNLTSKEKVEASQKKIEGCQKKMPHCSDVNAPEFCSTKIKLASNISGFKTFYSWGRNNCLAKNAMNKELCSNNLNSEYVGWNNCVPDASEGSCPQPKYTSCPKTHIPYKCFAGYYNDQVIPSNIEIRSIGTNECDARKKLKQEACEKNLNPDLLKQITCTNIKNNLLDR